MKNTWTKLISREGVDLLSISGLDVVFYDCVREVDRKSREPFFTIVQNKILTHYLTADSLEVGRAVYIDYFRTPRQVEQYYKSGLKFLKNAELAANKYRSQRRAGWELKAFQELRKQFMCLNYDLSIWPWWGIESWQIDFEKILKGLIKRRKLEAKEEQIIASVYKAWKKTAIVELQERFQKGEDVENLVQQYQFLRSWSLVWFRPINKQWIIDFGKKQVKSMEIEFLPKSKIFRLLKPNEREKEFLDLAPYISFFKDWRDDVRRKFVYMWSFFFDHLAQKFGVDRDDLGYLSLDELEKALKYNSFPKKLVLYRKEHPIVITTADGTLRMRILNHKIERYLKIARAVSEEQQHSLTIQGIIAQTGRVVGRVRLVKTYHDIKRVNAGDILVANTTHPNYLPGMQRAAAFVTNEGGMISHAAIVARELKKPCIVGSKIATEVLKDDDLVEVNANHGWVRKIKQ